MEANLEIEIRIVRFFLRREAKCRSFFFFFFSFYKEERREKWIWKSKSTSFFLFLFKEERREERIWKSKSTSFVFFSFYEGKQRWNLEIEIHVIRFFLWRGAKRRSFFFFFFLFFFFLRRRANLKIEIVSFIFFSLFFFLRRRANLEIEIRVVHFPFMKGSEASFVSFLFRRAKEEANLEIFPQRRTKLLVRFFFFLLKRAKRKSNLEMEIRVFRFLFKEDRRGEANLEIENRIFRFLFRSFCWTKGERKGEGRSRRRMLHRARVQPRAGNRIERRAWLAHKIKWNLTRLVPDAYAKQVCSLAPSPSPPLSNSTVIGVRDARLHYI